MGRVEPRDHLAVQLLTRLLRERRVNDLEAEEATLLLIARLARAFAAARSRSGQQWARVEQARALVAASPASRWTLGAVAEAVGCSPFHLARTSRAGSGETVGDYLLRLRLSLAVEQIACGERDLSRLALELGFAHHSHFTARFRSVLGLTPSSARKTLTAARLNQVRELFAREPMASARS